MDNREKFNIKQMVDCEKQEPFYPVTHAQAIQVIDDGELKNLQDILGVILEFIRNFGNFDFEDRLQLGCNFDNAFDGERGCTMWNELYPLSQEVTQNDSKPVSGGAVFEFVQGFAPDGEVKDEDNRAVSGDTVYDYIQQFIGGVIEEDNSKFVTGGDIFNYLKNFQANGSITSGDNRAVSGDTVWQALSQIGDEFWDTDENHEGSIKQKSTLNTLEVSNNNEVAIGEYNKTTDDSVFTVGIGTLQNRQNAIEVTNQLTDSLKVPFDNQSVSIQSHMRNEQPDILHLTQYLFDKLQDLINEKWKATWSFTGTTLGSEFYNGNTGIQLKWSIKDSEGQNYASNQIDTSYTKIQQNQNGSFVDVITGINTSNTTHNITDYTQNPFQFNFQNSGKCETTFKMFAKTKDNQIQATTTGKTASISLYAPSYIFYSTNPNITSIDNLPSGYKTVTCSSKSQFSASITIPSNGQAYIYIVTPQFINITKPTAENQPFKDADSGFEFSLSNEYYNNATKSFTVCDKDTTVNYNLVRSDQLLTQGTTWNIKSK